LSGVLCHYPLSHGVPQGHPGGHPEAAGEKL